LNAILRLQRFPATHSRSLVAYAIVAILWIAASLLIGGFGAYAHLRYIVELAAVIGLVGIGQTIAVIGGGIDLSVSAIITVTAIILPLVTFGADATGLGAIAPALLVAGGIGAVNGLGIGYLGLPPLIMTLAMATILQGLLILIAGGSAISVTNSSLDWLGSTHVLTISVSILLWAIVAAVCLFWLHGTRSGSLIFAIGANPVVSRLSGVPIRRLTLATYVISGFCAGLAGLLLLSMNGQGYVGIGDPYLLSSIAAVVLGGTLDSWRTRLLPWHDRGSGAPRADDGADHCCERVGRLAQRYPWLPDFGYAAIVWPRPVALRRALAFTRSRRSKKVACPGLGYAVRGGRSRRDGEQSQALSDLSRPSWA
jgi:ribose transport system permease protein